MAKSAETDTYCDIDASACTSRWEVAKAAIDDIVAASPKTRWGLGFFAWPGSEGCGLSSTPEIPPGDDQSAAISALLSTTSAGGFAPMTGAIDYATAYLQTFDDQNNKVILLVTDAEANCGPAQPVSSPDIANSVLAAGRALAAGIPVLVLGIGPNVQDLDLLATAGGTARHYPATMPEQLEQALAPPGDYTCTFTTSYPPADPNLVYVYVDKRLVSRDAANGWDFGVTTSTIVLTGSYCEKIVTADSVVVDIIFGCGPSPKGIPP